MAKFIFNPKNLNQLKPTYDAVIVGAGGTGLTAALQAHELGLKVAVLEKMKIWVEILIALQVA